ncbi:hypothetical protein J1605_002366, partial [Eschrichtius robustus]
VPARGTSRSQAHGAAPQDVPGLSPPTLLPQVPRWGQARKAEGWACTCARGTALGGGVHGMRTS